MDRRAREGCGDGVVYDVALGEAIDWLLGVVIRPVAVPLDTIRRGLVRGRAVCNDAGYNKLRREVFVVHFGRYCLG